MDYLWSYSKQAEVKTSLNHADRVWSDECQLVIWKCQIHTNNSSSRKQWQWTKAFFTLKPQIWETANDSVDRRVETNQIQVQCEQDLKGSKTGGTNPKQNNMKKLEFHITSLSVMAQSVHCHTDILHKHLGKAED